MAEHEKRAKRYPTDLTDAEWEIIRPFLPASPKRGRTPSTDLREVLNALVSDSEDDQAKQYLAVRRVSMRMEAMVAHAVEDATVVSQSLASRRHLPSHAKVRSTTIGGGGRGSPWPCRTV